MRAELAEKRLVWAINERYRKALESISSANLNEQFTPGLAASMLIEAKRALAGSEGKR